MTLVYKLLTLICSLLYFYRAKSAFIVICGALLTTLWSGCLSDMVCLLSASSFCMLAGILSLFSPTPLNMSFLCVTHVLVLVACSLGILGWSTDTACINMYSNHPVVFFICSHMCCSKIIGVLPMCFIFHVISLPMLVTWVMYDHPLWISLLVPYITMCAHGPLSSYCTPTVDLTDIKHQGLFEYQCFLTYFLS